MRNETLAEKIELSEPNGLNLKILKGRYKWQIMLKVWGPAWLVMIADVDAASVITAAQTGSVYGTKLKGFNKIIYWTFFILIVVTGIDSKKKIIQLF